MAKPVICCRLCNDTGIPKDADWFRRLFESLTSGRDLPDGTKERWCACAVGAYWRHKQSLDVRP